MIRRPSYGSSRWFVPIEEAATAGKSGEIRSGRSSFSVLNPADRSRRVCLIRLCVIVAGKVRAGSRTPATESRTSSDMKLPESHVIALAQIPSPPPTARKERLLMTRRMFRKQMLAMCLAAVSAGVTSSAPAQDYKRTNLFGNASTTVTPVRAGSAVSGPARTTVREVSIEDRQQQ